MDEYYSFVRGYADQDTDKQLENPAFHIHSGAPGAHEMPLTFALLLNLVSAANAEDAGVLWGFISRYVPGASPQTHPEIDRLVGFAIRYFNDFVKPTKIFRAPTDQETGALQALEAGLGELPGDANAEAIQNLVYEIGKQADFDPLRGWFKALYQVLLGQDQGPRFGSFVALYGIEETRKLITSALNGELT